MPSDRDLGLAADRSAIGAILDSQGRHREALVPLREALALVEAQLGPGHHEVGVLLGVLARVAERASEFEEAVGAYERALEIQRRVLGPDHPDVAETWTGLRRADTVARKAK